ncbi:MAG: hypothetical protein V3S01_09605 [Dehalococcoidia bacterium]
MPLTPEEHLRTVGAASDALADAAEFLSYAATHPFTVALAALASATADAGADLGIPDRLDHEARWGVTPLP